MFRIFHLFFILSLVGCNSNKSITDKANASAKASKEVSIYDLMDQSGEEQKPILIDLYTDWCLPCKVMDEQVYGDHRIATLLADEFVFHKVNAEQSKGRDMAYLFKVDAFPGLLFLDSKGKLIKKHQGGLSNVQFKSLCDEALAKFHDTKSKISG